MGRLSAIKVQLQLEYSYEHRRDLTIHRELRKKVMQRNREMEGITEKCMPKSTIDEAIAK